MLEFRKELFKDERDISNDVNPLDLRQFRQSLHAQNRLLCQRATQRPGEAVAMPDLEREVDENRRLYDAACINSPTATQCGKATPTPLTTLTTEQRQTLCAAYLPPTTTPPPQ